MILAIGAGVAGVLGLSMPLRWGLFGFLGGVCAAYFAMFAALSLRGFEGLPLSESLLLFEGSTVAYLSFNALVAYRAFALPLLLLAVVFIFRQGRHQVQ